jgi:mono/diheme cytochrome c family protein
MAAHAVLLSLWVSAALAPQEGTINQASRPAATGAELYLSACAACHGPDGTGLPETALGFRVPVPDFSDCSFATPEPDTDWLAVIHGGGPMRAFDRRMPAFGDVLSEPELQSILDHVRAFCTSSSWPRGELNFPRALFTEKAFPENEAVWTMTVASHETRGSIGSEFLYEQRIGARSQFEVVVPIEFQQTSGQVWHQGLGDLAVAFKQVLFHSLGRGTIVSAAGEAIFPTGKEDLGLGNGLTVFEPFVAVGQALPADGFFQVQAGFELPADRDAPSEAFWRVTGGKSFFEGRFGRSWSPMVEVLGARELEGGAATAWDVVPQLQVTLSTRQHIMINGGVRIPINKRNERDVQVVTYLLWDWFDGGFFDGW